MIYKKADSIVALSQPIKEAIEKKVVGKKIYIIPNFSDCDFYKPSTKNPALEEKFGVNGKFVVAYVGAVGVANGLDYFIECANTSRKANLPIHFIICGGGAKLQHLKSVAEKLQLKNISFTGFVNRDGVKELMNLVDAAFVCYKNIPILETGSPNKYFDALAAGKLIVINFGGWIKNEIEKEQCGIFVDPKHPTDFVKKIEPFITDKNLITQYQHASRTLAEEKYERKKLSTYFVNLISKR
jgi:glycosyltransferase involved in cell wall biosynthesis